MNFRHEPRDESTSATFGPNWDVGSPAILIVDDVPIHRMIICKVAIKAGFAPSEAENREDVRRLVAAVDFECATLDLSLGEQQGTEVLRDLFDLDFRAPIVIVSGSDSIAAESAFDFGRALGLNMLEPVGKPLDLARFRKILTRVGYETRRRRLVRSLA
jgi:DNA-binding NtrC family response regulator